MVCVLALVPALGCLESECPGAGSPLGLGSPLVESQWTTGGCYDSESWVAEVEGIAVAWTAELGRTDSPGIAVEAGEYGPAALLNGDLVLFDAEGDRVAERLSVGPSFQSSFLTTPSGQSISVAQTGGTPQYRVFDPSGQEVWLRLLAAASGTASGFPGVALDPDRKLWVALRVMGDSDFSLELQRWEVVGEQLETIVLPGLSSTWFAIDGAGRFAFVDDRLTLFDAQGVEIGDAEVDTKLSIFDLVGLADGFAVAGVREGRATISRFGADGAELWTTSLSGALVEYGESFAWSLAALPDGGVVAVGEEARISATWPDSPLLSRRQPFVVGFDAEGRPSWGERIAASGSAQSVAVGPEGGIYVGGYAQSERPNEYGYSDMVMWLRRYER